MSANNLLKIITRKRYWCDSNRYTTEPPAYD